MEFIATLQSIMLNPWAILILWILMVLVLWFCLIPALRKRPNTRN